MSKRPALVAQAFMSVIVIACGSGENGTAAARGPDASTIAGGAAGGASLGSGGLSGSSGSSGNRGSGGVGGATADTGGAASSGGAGGTGRTSTEQLTAGDSNSCARQGGEVRCWGYYGAIDLAGPGNYGDGPGEMGAKLPPVAFTHPVRSIVTGGSATCAIQTDDAIACVGSFAFESPGSAFGPVQSLGVSSRHACVVKGGTVWCWAAEDASGALGIGTRVGQSPGGTMTPTDLGTGLTAASVACVAPTETGASTCAVLTDGRLKCWGSNQNASLGIGASTVESRGDAPGEMGDALPFVDLGAAAKVKAVAMNTHSCALLDDGAVKCWGDGTTGALGFSTKDRDVGDAPGEMGDALPKVPLAGKAVAIGVGSLVSCALLDDGRVQCWGRGPVAYAATGGVVAMIGTVDLGTGRTAKALAVSEQHACVILDDDGVKCWGGNGRGELGLGNNLDRDTPEKMGDALEEVDLAPYEGVLP